MSDNARPYSLKPRMFRQPLWWWLGGSHNWSELLGHAPEPTKLQERPGLILRRFMGVRPRPISSWRSFYNRGRRGYDPSFDYDIVASYLLSWLPEAIALHRERAYSYPLGTCGHINEEDWMIQTCDCDQFDAWMATLDKIELGLLSARSMLEMEDYEIGATEENAAREARRQAYFDEAWGLMGKWFFHL